MPAVPDPPAAATAAARSVVYGLLAHGLAYPTPLHRGALQELFVTATDLEVADDGADGLDAALKGVVDATPEDLASLGASHQRTFTVIESRDRPAYETAYRDRDIFRQSHVMADIAGCYRAHGLRIGGRERDRPDHITVELEFMGFLAAKQAHATIELGPQQIEQCLHAQRLFLSEHLGCWAPSLGRRLEVTAEHTLYRRLGALLALWVRADMDHLGIEPATTLDEPVPPPPPDDGSCGVAEETGWPISLGRRRS